MIASLIAFYVAHQGPVVGLGVALLDLVFSLSPALKANGIAHWLYLALVSKKAPPSA